MAWLSKYSIVPQFPEFTGPYAVGSVDIEVPVAEIKGITTPSKDADVPQTSSARLFYPCSKPSTASQPIYWIQKPQRSIIAAFARFLGAGSAFSQFVSYFPNLFSYIKIPAHKNAPLLTPDNSTSRWPVLVFSHGLGGSRNTYSYICACLASYGILVIAPEHRDGSSPISHVNMLHESTKAKPVAYQNISHSPSDEVYEARDKQLRTRVWELNVAYELIMMLENGDEITSPASYYASNSKKLAPIAEVLSGLAGKLDVHQPGSIIWAGHSFGGATTIQLVKSAFYASSVSTRIYITDPASSLEHQINQTSPVALLDPWGLPVDSPATRDLFELPMPCFAPTPHSTADAHPDESPLLAVLSAAFVDWKQNFKTIKKVLTGPSHTTASSAQRPPAHIFYPTNSAHLAQSDFGVLFPAMAKYLAKSEDCEWTMHLSVRATLEILRRRGVSIAPPHARDLADSPEKLTSTDLTEDLTETHEGSSDWRILSSRPDAIAGWTRVALPPSPSPDSDSAASTPASEEYDKMAKTLPATATNARPTLKRLASGSATSIKTVASSLRRARLVRRSTSYGADKAVAMGHGGGVVKTSS